MKYLGEETAFWAALIMSLFVKLLLSAKITLRKTLGGLLAGGIFAYWGHDPVIRWIDGIGQNDQFLVIIGLAFTGEHIARWLIQITPEKALRDWLSSSKR